MAAADAGTPKNQGGITRRYVPLISLVVAMLITVVILPSSLNLPQSNPTEVLEYAPVPPDEDAPPPPEGGGFSSLNAAGSGTLSTRAKPPPEKVDLPPIGGQTDCVGDRQTEDPNSPPCKNFFTGDNGGATWQGVTGDTVNILIANSTGTIIDTRKGKADPTPPAGTYCDVDLMDCDGDGKTDDDPHTWIEVANAYCRYFNDRFQLYNRRAHCYYYWSGGESAADRRGDAADNWKVIKPFAVIPQFWRGGHHDAYTEAMSRRGVMVFASGNPQERAFFQKFEPNVWSYFPDVENWADLYTGYVCDKVKGSRVSRGPMSRQRRKYAILSTTDTGFPNLIYFRELAKQGMRNCGISWGDREYTFPYSGWWVDGSSDAQTYAAQNVADMRRKGVNTILWLGGSETKHSAAAASIRYYPEVVVAGDGDMDGQGFAGNQNQDFWNNAWSVSYILREGQLAENFGYRAYKEASPDGTNENWAVTFYRDYFMVWTAVQVAGPRLSPITVNAGLHAIERFDSTDADVAASYFFTGDFSFVKDAMETWWDSDARDPNGDTGCYRMVQDGLRFARDRWTRARYAIQPDGSKTPVGINALRYDDQGDLCTGYGGTGVGLRTGN